MTVRGDALAERLTRAITKALRAGRQALGLVPGQDDRSSQFSVRDALEVQAQALTVEMFLDAAGVRSDDPAVPMAAAQRYALSATNSILDMADGVWEDMRAAIADAFALGESVPQIAERLDGIAEVGVQRATTIARTEATRIANGGELNANVVRADALGTGDVAQKEWVSTHDARTRPSHVEADGQIVGLQESFTVGGFPLLHPGDPSGPPEETVNCRCTIAFSLFGGAKSTAHIEAL